MARPNEIRDTSTTLTSGTHGTASTSRGVQRIVSGMPTSDGAGVKLTRLMGTPDLPRLDPFLMLDEFRSDDPKNYAAGFPAHPHRGFETFTYMLAGSFRHEDNHGGRGLLGPGGGQWMTAGRGIVHSEMPEQTEGLAWGFQLWLNLPASEKMRAPGYQDVQADVIPTVTLDGGKVRLVSGRLGEVNGPIGPRSTEPVFMELQLDGQVAIPLPPDHAGFVYAFDGDVRIGEGETARRVRRGELAVLTRTGASQVLVASEAGPARALLVAGKPIGEPVVQYGPFVMNSVHEIQEAVEDFQAGKF